MALGYCEEGDGVNVMQILSSRVKLRCSNPLPHHLDAPRYTATYPFREPHYLPFCAAQSNLVNPGAPF